MKSLLSAIPFFLKTRAPGTLNRRLLVRAGVGMVALLAFSMTTVYAQEFTGTVKCLETHTRNNYDAEWILLSVDTWSVENEYPVIMDGSVIYDRWGTDKNVVSGSLQTFRRPGEYVSWLPDEDIDADIKKYFANLTMNFWTIPESRYSTCGSDQICLEMEELYSETGAWKFKVNRDQLQIRGTSYVTMEFPFDGDPGWTNMAAECTWNLSGLLADIL
jgi:hypothetical protein